jgi:predicted dehydrogenase
MTARIGLIGCGRWGSLILRDLVACGAEVHVVARSEASRARARAGGATSVAGDVAALARMDGFIVATLTITHAAVIESLLPTERPIFVEKPMTADLASARRLTAAAGDRLFVMDKWRYHPGIEAMRAEIAAGRAGEVLAIQSVRLGWGNPHPDVSALWILAPHDLAMALHLIGWLPRVRAVQPLTPRDPSLGLTAFLAEEGLPSVEFTIGVASPDHMRRCLVVGSKATLELRDGYDTEIFIREGAPGAADATARSIDVGSRMPLRAEIERFLGYIAGGPPPLSSAADGLLIVQRVAEIEAALASTMAGG